MKTDVTEIVERAGGATTVSAAFAKMNNYNTYVKKLNALANTIEAGNYAEAQAKIQKDLMKSDTQWVTKNPDVKAALDAELQDIYNELGIL